MIVKRFAAAAAVLVLAGCSTAVAGDPVVDPSALPRPDTGSFRTAPRTVEPANERQAVAAEGYRLVEAVPLPPDVDPAFRYHGQMTVGKVAGVKAVFGDGVAAALAGHEVAAYVSARNRTEFSGTTGQLIIGAFRMKDAEAAAAAAANPAVPAPDAGSDPAPAKEPVGIPGHGAAKAFTKRWGAGVTSTTALLPHGRYVLVAWTSAGVETVRKSFDLQIAALDRFTATPVDRFSTLPKDRDGLLTYTLGSSPTRDVTVSARVALADQFDITASRKNFEEAGVDLVARASNLVYRAKDSAGAAVLAGRFLDEVRGYRAGVTESAVSGVPGGRCLTYRESPDLDVSETYCVAPVGRYLAEVTEPQHVKAAQGIGASYLILRNAK